MFGVQARRNCTVHPSHFVACVKHQSENENANSFLKKNETPFQLGVRKGARGAFKRWPRRIRRGTAEAGRAGSPGRARSWTPTRHRVLICEWFPSARSRPSAHCCSQLRHSGGPYDKRDWYSASHAEMITRHVCALREEARALKEENSACMERIGTQGAFTHSELVWNPDVQPLLAQASCWTCLPCPKENAQACARSSIALGHDEPVVYSCHRLVQVANVLFILELP